MRSFRRMRLLQWYFYQEITAENYESDSQMYQNALDRDLKNREITLWDKSDLLKTY